MEECSFREDDLEFCFAARKWCQLVDDGDFEGYRRRFEETTVFFKERGRLEEGVRIGNEMIKTILEKTR